MSSGSDDEPQARSRQRYLHQPRQAIPADPSPITAPTISGYLLVGSGFHWRREDVPDYGRTRDGSAPARF